MKANAWNKSRVTPIITNFLVLIFSIIAPAIVKERFGYKYHSERETNKNVAEKGTNTLSRKASWAPSTALLLPFNFEGGKKGIT